MTKTLPKTLLIMRGPPGSGKSSLVGILRALTGCAIHSLDEYRMVDGAYKFDMSREKEVVRRYKEAFENSIVVGERLIVIDNVNSREWEYQKEKELAKKHGYLIHVVEVQADFWECMSRRSHPVPRDKMRAIFDRWETPISSAPETRLDGLEFAMDAVLQSQQRTETGLLDIKKAFGEEFNAVIIKHSMKDHMPDGEAKDKIEEALREGRKPTHVSEQPKWKCQHFGGPGGHHVFNEGSDRCIFCKEIVAPEDQKRPEGEAASDWEKRRKPMKMTKSDQEKDG